MEVEGDETKGGTVRAARPDDLPEKAQHSFEEALSTITPAAESVIAKLRSLSQAPAQIGLEFGLKLTGKGHFFVFSADTEGNFKVTLTWKRGE
jgi:Trypsin-co-occurring domain 1